MFLPCHNQTWTPSCRCTFTRTSSPWQSEARVRILVGNFVAESEGTWTSWGEGKEGQLHWSEVKAGRDSSRYRNSELSAFDQSGYLGELVIHCELVLVLTDTDTGRGSLVVMSISATPSSLCIWSDPPWWNNAFHITLLSPRAQDLILTTAAAFQSGQNAKMAAYHTLGAH